MQAACQCSSRVAMAQQVSNASRGGKRTRGSDEAVGNAAPPSLPSPPQSSLPGWSTESDLIHRLRSTPNVHVPNIARPPADRMLMSAALSHS